MHNKSDHNIPSHSIDAKGCSSSENVKLFFETSVFTFGLLNTAIIGEKELWINSCADLAMVRSYNIRQMNIVSYELVIIEEVHWRTVLNTQFIVCKMSILNATDLRKISFKLHS